MIELNELLQLRLPLVLASQSPRRRLLLQHVGFRFTTVNPDVDESQVSELLPHAEYVEKLAMLKAQRGAEMVSEPSIVIGSDTTVVLDGLVLNKPATETDARQMLQRLSGRTHEVFTGIAITVSPSISRSASRSTHVTFRELSDAEIDAYIATGSPMDKAGAYGIQDDFGAMFVSHINGCYYTIVGLPLELLYSTLKDFVKAELS